MQIFLGKGLVEMTQEVQKLLMPMALLAFSNNFPRCNIQCSE